MEKYEGSIPFSIAEKVANFYNQKKNNKRVLTVNTINFLLSQGACCLVFSDTNIIFSISIYFIFQTNNGDINSLVPSTVKNSAILRNPVSIKSSDKKYTCAEKRFRYIVFEYRTNKTKIIYPEKTVFKNVRYMHSKRGRNKKIDTYSVECDRKPINFYSWNKISDNCYELKDFFGVHARAFVFISSIKRDNIIKSVAYILHLSVEIEDLDEIVSVLQLLKEKLCVSEILISIKKFINNPLYLKDSCEIKYSHSTEINLPIGINKVPWVI